MREDLTIDQLVDQILQPEEDAQAGQVIDKRAMAASLLVRDDLPWLGDEKILGLALIANYCEDNDLKIYHFLQAACDSTRVLFIRNSKRYAELKFVAESLAGQLNGLTFEPLFSAKQKSELAFAFMSTPALWKEMSEVTKIRLLRLSLSYVEDACVDDIALALPVGLRWLPIKQLNHTHMNNYAQAWIINLFTMEPDVLALVPRLLSVFQMQLPKEKIHLEAVASLLNSTVFQQATEIKNTFALWCLIFKLSFESKVSDAAVLLHLITAHPDPDQSESAKILFKALAKMEQDVYGRYATPHAFFPGSANNNITGQFYCAVHALKEEKEPMDQFSEFLGKLFKVNVERYMELLTATPLSQHTVYLQSHWLIDLQEALLKAKDKVAVIQQVITQYKNLYKTDDEHLTWLNALNYFYSKKYDQATNLFRELMSVENGTYVDRASIILNVCNPHLSELPAPSMPKA